MYRPKEIGEPFDPGFGDVTRSLIRGEHRRLVGWDALACVDGRMASSDDDANAMNMSSREMFAKYPRQRKEYVLLYSYRQRDKALYRRRGALVNPNSRPEEPSSNETKGSGNAWHE